MADNKEYVEIGTRKDIVGGAVFSAGMGAWGEGYFYKSEKAIKEHRGICYIRESAFEHDDLFGEDFVDDEGNLTVTVDNLTYLVEMGCVATWDSAKQEVSDYLRNCKLRRYNRKKLLDNMDLWDEWNDLVDYITEVVLSNVEWIGIDMYLEEMDIDEYIKEFQKKRKKSNKK